MGRSLEGGSFENVLGLKKKKKKGRGGGSRNLERAILADQKGK